MDITVNLPPGVTTFGSSCSCPFVVLKPLHSHSDVFSKYIYGSCLEQHVARGCDVKDVKMSTPCVKLLGWDAEGMQQYRAGEVMMHISKRMLMGRV